ncbi:unnamed protein product [Linum trigynum]|uniref:Uncharacterized protein n=1 Tax=Linum trigynum TaxID=586398 RepID=A0AAV2CH70_9ROSI
MLDSFSEDISMIPNRSRNVSIKALRQLAIPGEGPRPPVAMAVKQFLLLASGSLLVPTFAQRCKLYFAPYIELTVEKKKEHAARAKDKPCVWVLGDCYFLTLHLLDSLSLRGFHTKTIPSFREEIAARNQLQPAANEGTSATATSSSAPPPAHAPMPTAEWWEIEDLTTLQLEQLKGLKEMTESMIKKWVARRDKVQTIDENLGQQE